MIGVSEVSLCFFINKLVGELPGEGSILKEFFAPWRLSLGLGEFYILKNFQC